MANFQNRQFSNQYFILILGLLTLILFAVYSNFNTLLDQNSQWVPYLLLLIFIFVAFISVFWVRYKLNYRSDDVTDKNENMPLKKVILASLYFSFFYILTILILFNWYSNSTSLSNIFEYILVILLTLNNIILLIQFNWVFKQLERPNGYLFKFLNKPIAQYSNDYETTFSLKVLFFTIFFIIPLILFYFTSKDIIESYILSSTALSLLIGGYWIGYGLYKQLLWIWGFQSNAVGVDSNKKERLSIGTIIRDFKYKEGKNVFWGFCFLIFSVILILGMLIKTVLFQIDVNNSLFLLLVIIYILFLYGLSFNITGKRSLTQPWYSILFTMFSFSIPFFFAFSIFYVFKQNSTTILTTFLPYSSVNIYLVAILVIVAILLGYYSNNRFLKIEIWRNHYETIQLLTVLTLSSENPSVIQLNLLQKIGILMEDRETILKLIANYQEILESENQKLKAEFMSNIYYFINNQLSIDADDELYDMLFNLANVLLDNQPKFTDKLFETSLELFTNGNSAVKNGSLNVLGHILQMNPQLDYAEKIFNEIKKNYFTNDEKLKRLILDALMFFAINFPTYSSKIKELLTRRLDYDTLGIATNVFSVLIEIYQIDKDEEIYSLAKNILESMDSPAKLGAIDFLRKNFPTEQEENDAIIKILLDNLKDIDNAIGVRPNTVYALNDCIKTDSNKSYLLPIIKQYIDDEDSDVKSAVIQSFTEQFLLRKASFADLNEIFTHGMEEHDYIVRLVVIQSLKSIINQEKTVDKNFMTILERAQFDENQIIQDAAKELMDYKN